MMEGLNIAIKTVCSKFIFHGIKVPKNGRSIFDFFYAEDAIFVGDRSKSNLKNMGRILRCFQFISGLKVKFYKSRVFGICVDESETKRQGLSLGCMVDSLPFTYLEVLVRANMKRKKSWKPIVER